MKHKYTNQKEGERDYVNDFITGSRGCPDGSGCNWDRAGAQQPLIALIDIVIMA
jgi:hypothetical protein